VSGNSYVTIGDNAGAVMGQTGQGIPVVNGAAEIANSYMVNLAANAVNGSALPATFGVSLFSAAANRFLNLELSAMENDNKGKVISSPRIVTADQKKARIEQGEDIPYQVVGGGNQAPSIQFKTAALVLDVTPQITPEGNVIMDVSVAKDSRGVDTIAGPTINTKRVETQVLVENGGTVVIGGIFTLEENDNVNKVPLLGDIPFLGALFRNTTRIASKTETLIFITPKIVTDRSAIR
jgi:type IV pilus assembly protein PilQ